MHHRLPDGEKTVLSGNLGLLISVEGIDFAGKTSQIDLLKEAFISQGYNVTSFKFPAYSTDIGHIIWKVLNDGLYIPSVALLPLFAANRLEHKANILNSLTGNDLVLLDRYSESLYAYGSAMGLPATWLRSLESMMPAADLVVVLDISSKLATERAFFAGRSDSFERDIDLLDSARQAYLELVDSPPVDGQKWVSIDSSRSMKSVHKILYNEIDSFLRSSSQ